MGDRKQQKGGRPAMSALDRRRVRAALQALRARHASWEALAQALRLRARTLARIMNEDAGASMDTVARIAEKLMTAPEHEPMSYFAKARELLLMKISEIRALGDHLPSVSEAKAESDHG